MSSLKRDKSLGKFTIVFIIFVPQAYKIRLIFFDRLSKVRD